MSNVVFDKFINLLKSRKRNASEDIEEDLDKTVPIKIYVPEEKDERRPCRNHDKRCLIKKNQTSYYMRNGDLKPSELDNFATCIFRYDESGTLIELGAFIDTKMSDEELINVFKQKLVDFTSMEIKLTRKDEA